MGRFDVSEGIFRDESVLFEEWVPDDLPEREAELDAIESALMPAVRSQVAPHNAFIYGKTGQGKTAGVEYILRELRETTATIEGLDVEVVNYSCAQDTSSYTVVCNLVEHLSGTNPNGHPKKRVFDRLYEELETLADIVIVVLDEIDTIGSDDDILYELPRARSNGHLETTWISVIGISNDFDFRSNLSPKVKDSLCDEEIHFQPYNAGQLRSILSRRAEKAFHAGTLDEETIPLAAALAAQDKGSARQAIRYLYKAGELASEEGADHVSEAHVKRAEEIIERQAIEKGIRDLTTQDTLALLAVIDLETDGEAPGRTRAVYSRYCDLCEALDRESIAMRRVRDHLLELDMIGVVNATEHNTGVRGGQHYRWDVSTDVGTTLDVISETGHLADAYQLVA